MTYGQRTDVEQTRGRVVGPLSNSTVKRGSRQTRRKQVGQINVRRANRTVVSNRNIEGNRVAFGWSTVTAGKRLDRHKIGCVIDNYRFFQIITDS